MGEGVGFGEVLGFWHLPNLTQVAREVFELPRGFDINLQSMKIPSLREAEKLLTEAEQLNPGPWVAHSRSVALAARCIAEHSSLDADAAYIMGLLHDIGRREGITKMRHTLDGYRFLQGLGFDDAARICITHSFVLKNMEAHEGRWDCSDEELKSITDFVNATEFDDYDKLFQLCDALALAEGICLLEKRIVNVALRIGVNGQTVAKWKALFEVQKELEQKMGQSIYKVLPGVVETTFGF
jgi:HD superfamily phosphohydrolase YqeK